MQINELRKKAKAIGLKIPKDMKKGEIIRALQEKEGNFPCFGSTKNYCDQQDCLWRSDCMEKNQ